MRPKGLKRPRKASAEPTGGPALLEKVNFYDESDDKLFEMEREKPAPQRYVIITMSGFQHVFPSRQNSCRFYSLQSTKGTPKR